MAKTAVGTKPDYGSAFTLFGKGIEIVKKNWQMFTVVNILAIASALGSSFGSDETTVDSNSVNFDTNFFETNSPPLEGAIIGLGIAAVLAYALVALFLYTMSVSLQLKASRGKQPSFSEIASEAAKNWIKMFLLFLLSGIIIVIGFILLIVPGFIAITRLVLAPYVMVDQNLGVIDAIKESNRLAKGDPGAIWGPIGVYILIAGIIGGIIGLIPFIGMLISTVLGIICIVIFPQRYYQLKQAKKV